MALGYPEHLLNGCWDWIPPGKKPEHEEISLRSIIYAPQQTNMDSIFSRPGEQGDDGNVWHAIQRQFRACGYELYTPATYVGDLRDVSWVLFQNIPRDFKPLSVSRRVRTTLKRLSGSRTFYRQCLRAGLSERIAVILYEPPVVEEFAFDKKNHRAFSTIFTWSKDLLENGGKYKDIVFPERDVPVTRSAVPFEERKLLCNFSANKTSSHQYELYSARKTAIKFFERACSDNFDHYGAGWSPDYTSWRGKVDDKLATMARYRFNLCYENASNLRGYLTEKIFDAFHAGCVPIYLGAPDIDELIPSSTFIDRRNFASDSDLLDFIMSMSEAEWQDSIDAAWDFLQSENYKRYTADGMFELLRDGLRLQPSPAQ